MISVYVFGQVMIILTHSDVININIFISKKQMFNNLLTVFNMIHFMKNKPGSVNYFYLKSINSAESPPEAEKGTFNNQHCRNR